MAGFDDLNLKVPLLLASVIIISILEPCFPQPRVGLIYKSFSKACQKAQPSVDIYEYFEFQAQLSLA